MVRRNFHRISAGLVALVTILTACSWQPRVETPDPPGFRRVEAAGPFSVAIPRELSRLPVIGVDTEVDEFVGEGLRLGFSYGMYGSVPLQDGLLDYATGELNVDGRRGRWAAYKRGEDAKDGRPYGWVGHVGTPAVWGARRGEPIGLTIYLSCSTRQICKLGPQIADTVQFE